MSQTIRQAKIVATLGPNSSNEEVIGGLIDAGTDVFRLNLSHGTAQDHVHRARLARRLAAEKNRNVAIMVDLQGPKIRIESFKEGQISLKDGATFTLDAKADVHGGTTEVVALGYEDLPKQLRAGNRLLLDDGKILLTVVAVNDAKIVCRVVLGGILKSRKGINIEGGGLQAGAFTEEDRINLVKLRSQEIDLDYVALSFVNCAQDLRDLGTFLQREDIETRIIAKVETRLALENLQEIVVEADAVMIARGDLGVEIGDERLPAAQRLILKTCSALNRPVITATQMMESMVESPIPTRAEVLDVANAVSAGTDAVMLSAETATGNHPIKTVAAMARVAKAAGADLDPALPMMAEAKHSHSIDQTIAMAAMYAAGHSEISAIVALTETGNTALLMSRHPAAQNIFALTPSPRAAARMALFRGVHPMLFDFDHEDHGLLIKQAIQYLVEKQHLDLGDCIALTKGSQLKIAGGTNLLGIYRVSDLITQGPS